MVKRTLLYPIILTAIIIIVIPSCKKSKDTSTPPAETVTDIDGNVYHTVIIGTQEWMVENLKTTKYNNGNPIPCVTDSAAWKNLTTPGYCWYNNDPVTYKDTYGALYNWYSIDTGNLAPTGWHVATMENWYTLFNYIADAAALGGKMKETGTAHWMSPNAGATNSSGFTALPGGGRVLATGTYIGIGQYGYWWSSTEISIGQGWGFSLSYTKETIDWIGAPAKTMGLSVRCVKNQ